MSAVPLQLATPLAGGEWFSGIALALTAQMVWRYGLKVGITNDKKRQILLNLICFLCALNTTISYGFNATRASVVVSDVTTIITFLCVQYSLVILNHNTLIRATNIVSSVKMNRTNVDMFCKILYVLPLFVLVPIYYAFADMQGTGKAMNTSTFNSLIYKPLNIALLFATEGLATFTDILLLLKVKASTNALNATAGNLAAEISASALSPSGVLRKIRRADLASRDLWMNYAITWSLIFIDAVVKILIALGLPLLFDSIITITTVAMRSRTNLQYGLELQAMVSAEGRPSSSSIASSRQRSVPYISQAGPLSPPPASAPYGTETA